MRARFKTPLCDVYALCLHFREGMFGWNSKMGKIKTVNEKYKFDGRATMMCKWLKVLKASGFRND